MKANLQHFQARGVSTGLHHHESGVSRTAWTGQVSPFPFPFSSGHHAQVCTIMGVRISIARGRLASWAAWGRMGKSAAFSKEPSIAMGPFPPPFSFSLSQATRSRDLLPLFSPLLFVPRPNVKPSPLHPSSPLVSSSTFIATQHDEYDTPRSPSYHIKLR